MAINQASFFFYAPRYTPEVELDHQSKMADGSPVQIIGSELSYPDADRVSAGQIKTWFEQRGFKESESWGRMIVLSPGFAKTFFGEQEKIKLTIPADPNDEIDCLYIRFLLERNNSMPIEQWENLVIELGMDFGFELMTPDTDLTNCLDFRTMLELNSNFQMFNQNN